MARSCGHFPPTPKLPLSRRDVHHAAPTRQPIGQLPKLNTGVRFPSSALKTLVDGGFRDPIRTSGLAACVTGSWSGGAWYGLMTLTALTALISIVSMPEGSSGAPRWVKVGCGLVALPVLAILPTAISWPPGKLGPENDE